MQTRNLPGISVVIPCHDAAGTLDVCLSALRRSKWPVRECIVVDDASNDGTAEKADSFGATVVRCVLRGGPARARNIGVEHVTSDIVLFLDADVAVHEDTITRVMEVLADESVDAVIGAYDDAPAEPSFISQYRNLLHCFTHRRARRNASTFWCGCGAIRRAVFVKRGGLPESYKSASIEDIEFGHHLAAAGGSIVLDPRIQVKHLKLWTFSAMLRTDIFDRAVPWTRLILRTHSMKDDLNLRWNQRAAVAFAFLTLATSFTTPLLIPVTSALTAAALNYHFYAFLAERRGMWFALRAVPLHFAFHLYSGFGFALGAAAHFVGPPGVPDGVQGAAPTQDL
jgi:glycosyltransferase involved in cell wall biosynthesis